MQAKSKKGVRGAMVSQRSRIDPRHIILLRIMSIIGFALLTAISARMRIRLPYSPIPITLQVFVVLLAGFALGSTDGAASQALYLTAICAGLPLDANGLGIAVWTQPTAGYLASFVVAAFVTGRLMELGFNRNYTLSIAAGLVGVILIYFVGAGWLTYGFLGGDWASGWRFGVAPFILVDFGKAVFAALFAKHGKALIATFRSLT